MIKREWTALSILIMVLLSVLYYTVFLVPVTTENEQLLRSIHIQEEELLRRKVLSEKIAQMQDSVDHQNNYTMNTLQHLPETIAVSQIILMLSGIDPQYAIKNSVVFLNPVYKEKLTLIPIRLTLQSNTSGFVEIMKYLDAIPADCSIVSMQLYFTSPDTLKNSADIVEENSNLMYNLNIVMTIHFFTKR